MKRIVFIVIAALSLLLCGVFAAACLRSLVADDFFEVLRFRTYLMGHTRPGKVQVRVCLNYDPRHFWGDGPAKWYVNHSVLTPAIDWETSPLPTAMFNVHGGGFMLAGMPTQPNGEFGTVWFFIGFPYWFAMLLTAVLPAWWFYRWRRRRRLRITGCCRVCGYDLRATPERCPECGHVPAGVAA